MADVAEMTSVIDRRIGVTRVRRRAFRAGRRVPVGADHIARDGRPQRRDEQRDRGEQGTGPMKQETTTHG